METEILEIEGVNFGPYLSEDGLVYRREDILSNGSGRKTLNRKFRAKIIRSPVHLHVSCLDLPLETSRTLLAALQPGILNVRYEDPEHGLITRRFVNLNPEITLHRVYRDGRKLWRGLEFELVEE